MKPLVMHGVGYLFLVLGVLGLFLPFLQGFLFLFIGLVILARYAPWARKLLDRLRAQHPKVDEWIDRAERRLHHWGERISGRPGG